MHIVFKHLNEPIPQRPEAYARYQPLLERMTAKDPDDRFANASELLTAVTELRVNNAVGGIDKKNKGRRKTDEKLKGVIHL